MTDHPDDPVQLDGGPSAMIACPWCEEDASDLLACDEEAFQCPACGTCVDLVDEPRVLDAAA